VSVIAGGGCVLVLDGRDCAGLHAARGHVRAAYRATGTTVPEFIEDMLHAASEVAQRWHAWVATSATASDVLPQLDALASEATQSRWLTTREAAVLIGITDRAVRQAAQEGRIRGQRCNGRGTWLIAEDSAIAYRRGRAGDDTESGGTAREGGPA
jgi:excisionase family DNA binding protein